MAKVGNEVRLVLSLARERADALRRIKGIYPRPCHDESDYLHGLNRGLQEYQDILDHVVQELEAK